MSSGERAAGSLLTPLESWSDVLDEFESSLDRAETKVAEVGDDTFETDPVVLFTPPPSMPPMPVEVADRAQRLAARHELVVKQVEVVTSELRDTTVSSAASGRRHATPHRSPTASSFDVLA